MPSDTKAPFSFFQIKHDGDEGNSATSAMLNHQDGNLNWYTGGFTFIHNMKNQWIPIRVIHNGPSKDIHIYVGEGYKIYKKYQADSTVKHFHFKFGPYLKQLRNNKHEKFETRYKDISMSINNKKLSLEEWSADSLALDLYS